MNPVCFGRYVLLDRIAAGGMGEVFLAHPRTLWGFEKFFAIKKVLPQLGRDPEFLARFRDEARLVIPMNHPNVVQVHEVGRVGEDYFIAMEFVEGQSLGQLLGRCWRRQEPIPVAGALFIIRELLAGLEYCHRRTDQAGRGLGLVHRDISPSNVLISFEGGVKLADFGLALSSLKSYQTRPNLVFGHLGYIAPEALDGRRQDQRSDIFSIAVLLFELLTARRFCDAADPAAARLQLRSQARVRPSSLRPGLPGQLDGIVQRALAPAPADRFQSARELHDEVQALLVRLDPLYSPARLAETVLRQYFDVEGERQRLRDLLRGLDLDEIEARQEAGRTFCIGEAIPLAPAARRPYGNGAAVLTLLEDLSEGDTEPQSLGSLAISSPPRIAPARPPGGTAAGRRRPRWLTPVPLISRSSPEEAPSSRRPRFIESKTNQ